MASKCQKGLGLFSGKYRTGIIAYIKSVSEPPPDFANSKKASAEIVQPLLFYSDKLRKVVVCDIF